MIRKYAGLWTRRKFKKKKRRGNSMKNNFENSNILNQFKKLNLGCHEKSWQSKNTYRKTTQRILRFCYENFNVQKIENIQNKHIRAYIESQEEKSLSALKKEMSGFRYYVNLLNNINISRDRKQCKFNLSNKDLGINGPKEFNERTAPTIEELNNIFDEIDEIKSEEIRKVIRNGTYLGAYLGLRSKEIFCLKVGQIKDVIYQISSGEPPYLQLDGEGCKGGRPRQIGPLSKKQQEVLMNIYTKDCKGKHKDDYILRDRSITNSLQKRLTVWHNFYTRIGYEVSCDKRKSRPEYDNHISAHSLRRFFAVNLYKKLRKSYDHEKSFSIVSANLGHGANRKELSRHYLNEL